MGGMGNLEAAPWTRTAEQCAEDLGTNLSTGLSSAEVAKRREKYGFNELVKEPGTPLWRLVLEQFDDMLVKILLVAACVSFALAYLEEDSHEQGIRAYIEPLVILLILILNAIVGVWQESNAEAALEALKELQSETARVLRDGKLVSDLPARELVPGDIVDLEVGDKVPADMRVAALKTATLRAEQSSLTGEPVAVLKGTEPVHDVEVELQAKECMLFASTTIANGHASAIVTATGMSTEIGKIQAQIAAAAAEEEDTPLQQKLDEFGELLAKVIFGICVLVWVINYHHFLQLSWPEGSWLPDWRATRFSLSKATYYFKIAVALAVAAIPEGLPAVITTCLALGTRKMAAKNAIVRKLPSVETLGCTTVICSDKTGTLTTNQMSAVALAAIAADGSSVREYEVTGVTYNPDEGEVVGLPSLDAALSAAAEVCALCSEAGVEVKGGTWRAVGAPTEAALKVLAEKLGPADARAAMSLKLARTAATASSASAPHGSTGIVCEPVCGWYKERCERLALLEFDRNRKSMSVIVRAAPATRSTTSALLVKGAAECVLDRCTHYMLPSGKVAALTPAVRRNLDACIEAFGERALRTLALARRSELPAPLSSYDGSAKHAAAVQLRDPAQYEAVESGLTFLALAGLQDPPRTEVPSAIADCRGAGIRVIVITGDNKKTAEAICRSIGVLEEDQPLEGSSFTGREFAELLEEEQMRVLGTPHSLVFSRAEPRHKQDIVRMLKHMGQVTAMTGDGVNDAPALKLADIGVAMGIAGTEVAKEASDMVLADDNFSTIVAAVAEGRSIYANMKAFIRYMISSNIGEVASIFLTALLGLPEGLIPVQLLWVNLVTDGPPATALGFNPADVDIMDKPPRRSDEQLITPWVFARYIVIGAYVGFATVGAFVTWYMYDSFLGLDLSGDGHTTVTWYQLTHWEECPTWKGFTAVPYSTAGGGVVQFDQPCEYFSAGKAKASTLSLSVLVAIEMFNAFNALSEDHSLLEMPPWANPWLAVATIVSLGLHCVILYIPFLADVFSIVPLSLNEWGLVLAFSLPVVLIDEVLKLLGRNFFGTRSTGYARRRRRASAAGPSEKAKEE